MPEQKDRQKTNKCLLRMLESVIKVIQRNHWHMKTLKSVFHIVKIIPNRSMAVFILMTDYLSETDNPMADPGKGPGGPLPPPLSQGLDPAL